MDYYCAHSQGPGDNSVPGYATLATASKERYKLQDSVFISQVSSAVAVIRKRSLGHNIAVRMGSSSATRSSHSLLQLGEGWGRTPAHSEKVFRQNHALPHPLLYYINTQIPSFQIINVN